MSLNILSAQKFTPKATTQGISALIYGEVGCGKTTFAANAPDCLLLSADARGYEFLSDTGFTPVDIRSWADFKEALSTLQKPEAFERYKSVVIDDVGHMLNYLAKFVVTEKNNTIELAAKKKKKSDEEVVTYNLFDDIEFGKGVTAQIEHFTNYLAKLLALPYNFIFLCHSEEKKISDTETQFVPQIPDKIRTILTRDVKLIGFVSMNNKGVRKLSFDATNNAYFAKNRIGIDKTMSLDYAEFQAAIEKRLPKPGTANTEEPKVVKVDSKATQFKTLKAKFTELTADLTNDKTRRKDVVDIVDGVLGKGGKVSDLTSADVELLQDIINQVEDYISEYKAPEDKSVDVEMTSEDE